jgi:hypothetical protein
VKDIIDPLVMQLEDGRIVQLAGLDIPDFSRQGAGDIAFEAKTLMKKIFEGKKVTLYQSTDPKMRLNRMEHELVHLALSEENTWAQGVLLSEGLARVRTTVETVALSDEMYDLEDKARQAPPPAPGEPPSRNLWLHPIYNILTPETALRAPHFFQVVEGKILKVAVVKNVIYLNFGKNWRTDFSIGIKPDARRLFSKMNQKPQEWIGKTVRVRGWLENYNGPYIDIDHPQRIELIDEEKEPEKTVQKEKDNRNALPDFENLEYNPKDSSAPR